MTELIINISKRIKELREISGISVEKMANDLHLGVNVYKSYENGEVEIPISVLSEISQLFNVEMSEILTGASPKLHTYSLVRAGKGYGVERRKEYIYQSLAYNFAQKKIEPFMVTVPPSSEGDEIRLSSHPGQEMDYVVEGTMKVVSEGKELILNEGDTLYFNSDHPHGMQSVGDKPAKFIAIVIA